MKTYQDLEKLGNDEIERGKFIMKAITDFKSSEKYSQSEEAEEYATGKNPLITKYQKFLYTAQGKQVPDNFSPNYKLRSNFFYRFITQVNQYLLIRKLMTT